MLHIGTPTAFIFALCLSVPCSAETPTALMVTPGQPLVALFQPRHEAYAIGCSDLANLWNAVPVQRLSPQEWGQMIKANPITAHISCDSRTTPFDEIGQPGGLIFEHEDHKKYRHYVNNAAFRDAIRGVPVLSAPSAEILRLAPNRGPDFQTSMKAAAATLGGFALVSSPQVGNNWAWIEDYFIPFGRDMAAQCEPGRTCEIATGVAAFGNVGVNSRGVFSGNKEFSIGPAGAVFFRMADGKGAGTMHYFAGKIGTKTWDLP